jgi:hypothetical protein
MHTMQIRKILLTLSLSFVVVSFSGFAQQSARVTQNSGQERAQSWIQGAMNAMGGEEKLKAIHAIEIKGIGIRNQLEQSERPEGPWLPDFYQSDETRDFANNRTKVERQSRTLNFTGWDNSAWSNASTTVTAGGVVALFSQGKFRATSPAFAADTEETLALDPLRVLFTALQAQDLHAAADSPLHGFAQHVIAFSWNGESIRLFLSPDSQLPTRIEATRVRPMDFFQGPWGDVTIQTEFATWSLDPSGVRYPRQWSDELNGQPNSTYTANEVKVNPQVDDAAFAIPEDVKKASMATALNIDDMSFAAGSGAGVEIVPGVAIVRSGLFSYRATEIRQSDGIVILEGQLSNGYTSKVIADAEKRFPGLRVKAVVTTSDSWPHIGGLREYAARGISIYALDLNRPVLTRLMNSPHKIQPDDLAKSGKAANFNFISQRTTVGAGENRIEVIPFRTATGERQMMVYFPAAKIVYTSDLFSLGRDGSLFLPQTAQEFMDAAAREKLEVDRVYGMHYDAMPFAKIQESLAKYLGAKQN